MRLRHLVLLALAACGGRVSDALSPTPAAVVTSPTAVPLSAAPGFADERGGGLFVDLAGRVVRLRPDGTQGALESHPANAIFPDAATALWPLGPASALAVTGRGLFIAEQGWLISPPWQGALDPAGVRGVTVADDAIAWVAHAQGLYRLQDGQLSQLQVGGQSVTGLVGVAAAPAPDGHPGVWFATATAVRCAAQQSRRDFVVTDSALTADDLAGGVLGVAGLGATGSSPGELWVLTPHLALQFTQGTWHRYTLGKTPRRVLAAGRYAWLEAGDTLYRYDADAARWLVATGLDATPTLLAVDATGTAWARVGAQTLAVSFAATVRLQGLFEGATQYDGQQVLTAALPAAPAPTSLSWQLDDAPPTTVNVADGAAGTWLEQGQLLFSLGGVEASGKAKPVSFSALADGWHTLSVTAAVAEVTTTRRLHFNFQGSATAVLSYARDVQPISDARCAKCHATGTLPELKTYAQWKANAASIATAVTDKRMPADGPLDPTSIQTVARWVTGGALP